MSWTASNFTFVDMTFPVDLNIRKDQYHQNEPISKKIAQSISANRKRWERVEARARADDES